MPSPLVGFLQSIQKPREPVKSLFHDQNKNSIFHQKNSISLSRIDAEKLALATEQLIIASNALHQAAAALYGYDDIEKCHLSLAHSFVDTYIYQFSEYSLQSTGGGFRQDNRPYSPVVKR